MPFKYQPFKVVTNEMSDKEAFPYMQYNRSILAEGVKGLACLDVRPVTRGERLDYEQFAPAGCMLTSVEIYEDGSMNIFVRDKLRYLPVGVITVRPLIEVDCAGKITNHGGTIK